VTVEAQEDLTVRELARELVCSVDGERCLAYPRHAVDRINPHYTARRGPAWQFLPDAL
jgi:sorbitol-specific phosphotransferase system component IIBC